MFHGVCFDAHVHRIALKANNYTVRYKKLAIGWGKVAVPLVYAWTLNETITELTPFVAWQTLAANCIEQKLLNYLEFVLAQTEQRQPNAILNRVSVLGDCSGHFLLVAHTKAHTLHILSFRHIFRTDKLVIIRKLIRLWPGCVWPFNNQVEWRRIEREAETASLFCLSMSHV